MKKAIITFCSLLLFISLKAENVNPEQDEIYREGEVAVIKLVMSEEDKAFLLHEDNVFSDEYLPASFQFTNSLIDTLLSFNIGLRLRGNSSRTQPKKSIKIKFKEFDGEKFFGYKKFNLKAENNDPSMIREMLTMQTYRKMNVPAARTHHAELYINEEYMGLYLNVEQLDDEFAKSRFTSDEGNLYKCAWGATLKNDGQINDNDIYELKTNESDNDRTLLANFVNVLNGTPSDELEEALEKVFNVQGYIRQLAVEALMGHWDGYSYNKNNFYLYENPDSGLIDFIPYDTDNTFGINWIDRDWANRDVLDWPTHGESRPLTERILFRPKYLNQYKLVINEMLLNDYSEAYFFPEFDKYKALLADAVSRDTYFPLTFEYVFADFENSFTQEVVGHAPYGLKPYITTRTTSAREQIGTITEVPKNDLAHISIYPNPSNGYELFINTDHTFNQTAISIINMQGSKCQFTLTDVGSKQSKVSFNSKLGSGVYMILLDGNVSKMVVK